MSDPYTDPRSGVLRNKLGISDAAELAQAEADLSAVRLYELAAGHRIEGGYDLAHLQDFHRYVFQDVYPWAGELRTVNIAKGDLFCPAVNIESFAGDVFGALRRENHLQGLDRGPFVDRLSHFYIEMNALHPFREGNGRSQRAFLSQLAQDAGYPVEWSGMDPDAERTATIAGFHGNVKAVSTLLDPQVAAQRVGRGSKAGPSSSPAAAIAKRGFPGKVTSRSSSAGEVGPAQKASRPMAKDPGVER